MGRAGAELWRRKKLFDARRASQLPTLNTGGLGARAEAACIASSSWRAHLLHLRVRDPRLAHRGVRAHERLERGARGGVVLAAAELERLGVERVGWFCRWCCCCYVWCLSPWWWFVVVMCIVCSNLPACRRPPSPMITARRPLSPRAPGLSPLLQPPPPPPDRNARIALAGAPPAAAAVGAGAAAKRSSAAAPPPECWRCCCWRWCCCCDGVRARCARRAPRENGVVVARPPNALGAAPRPVASSLWERIFHP